MREREREKERRKKAMKIRDGVGGGRACNVVLVSICCKLLVLV